MSFNPMRPIRWRRELSLNFQLTALQTIEHQLLDLRSSWPATICDLRQVHGSLRDDSGF